MIYLPSSPLPSILYMATLLVTPDVAIFTDEPYLKQTYRNRFDIYGATGRLSISIPVEKYPNPAPPTALIAVSEHGDWRRVAEQSIRSAYNSSPYFEYYEEEMMQLLHNPTPLLIDYNEAWLKWFCSQWGMELPMQVPEDELTVDGYHMPEICDRNLNKHLPIVLPHYYQTFGADHGFMPNLSVLDLICNMGPEGLFILQQTAQKWSKHLPE